MIKKLLIATVSAFVLMQSFTSSVFAQTTTNPWYAPTYEDFNKKVESADESEIFGERYTQAQVYWIFYSLQNVLASSGFNKCVVDNNITYGSTDVNAVETCTSILIPTQPPGVEDKENVIAANRENIPAAWKDPGLLLGLAMLTDTFRNTRPASGVDYIAQSLENFHIVPEAYAQGFGYQTLSASQPLWTAARNMAYGLLVLVFIAFAFAIMLRVKLSPQTVITVQSVLPKIIIAMILIWFSYAIAGLLIDVSFLVQGLIAAFIKSTTVTGNPAGLTDRTVIEFLTIMNMPVYSVTAIGLLFLFLGLVVGGVTLWAGGAAAAATGGLAAIAGFLTAIVMLLIFIAFVITLVRLIWLFLMTYVKVLLLVIAGPFFILGGAIGIAGGVMGWIKNLAAQLSVFVVASILVVFAHIFIWGTTNALWQPFADFQPFNPFLINPGGAPVGSAQLPGFGAGDQATIGLALGFVLLLGTPNLATIVRDMLVKPSRLQLVIGTAFAPIIMPGKFISGGITQGISRGIGGVASGIATDAFQKARARTQEPKVTAQSQAGVLPFDDNYTAQGASGTTRSNRRQAPGERD